MNDKRGRKNRPIATVVGVLVAGLTYVGIKDGVRRYREHRAMEDRTAAWGLDAKTRDRVHGTIEREAGSLTSNPSFKAFLAKKIAAKQKAGEPIDGSAFGKGLGKALVARGLPRLSDPDLATIQSLKKKMAAVSDRACPCYWDAAGCAEADVMDGLARLSDPELATWARLSSVAGIAELEATHPIPATQPDFQKGLTAIVARLPPEQNKRFVDTMDAKPPVPKADQCFAIRAVFDGVDGLPPADRPRFVRALANLGAGEDPL